MKKNKSLEILNLSRNELFGIDDKRNKSSGAKKLSKAMKDHPELAYVNLASTGIGENNEGLKLLLDGGKSINILIIDDNALDEEGLELVTNFLQKKNETTELGMDSIGIGEGDSSKAKSKLLKEMFERNSTLEQLSLASNSLGNAKGRVLSTVMSGMKRSESLVYVDLSGNDIRRMPSLKLVAKYLASNPSLVGLDLSNNFMPAKSAVVLMQSLKTNTTLQHLYLRNNRISDKSVPGFTEALQNNTTLRNLDLQNNSLKVQTGRKVMIKALCDMTSLDSIVNSNHTCSIVIAGSNYGGTFEQELGKINALENEGEKIRYKVVLAKKQNKELINNRMFDDVPLELMPRVLELVQQEIGCHGYGEGIVESVKKRNTINRLSNLYELISLLPDFHLLFARGPGKGSLTKTGKLKKKQDIVVKRKRVADEDEDFVPNGIPKAKKRKTWRRTEEGWRFVEPEPVAVAPSRSSSRLTNITNISYADAENSEDES